MNTITLRKNTIILRLSALLLLGLLSLPQLQGEGNQQSTAKRTPMYTISASDLYAEIKANEVRAAQKYKGKVIQVSGTVKDFGIKTLSGNPYLELNVNDYSGDIFGWGIQMIFPVSYKSRIANMEKGQFVTAIGECSNMTLIVMVNNCEFVEPQTSQPKQNQAPTPGVASLPQQNQAPGTTQTQVLYIQNQLGNNLDIARLYISVQGSEWEEVVMPGNTPLLIPQGMSLMFGLSRGPGMYNLLATDNNGNNYVKYNINIQANGEVISFTANDIYRQ